MGCAVNLFNVWQEKNVLHCLTKVWIKCNTAVHLDTKFEVMSFVIKWEVVGVGG